MPKIRVGFVMHKMQVAGAEVLVTQIIDRLADEIEPVVFCLDAIGELGQRLIERGVPVVSFDREPGLDWSVARRLAAEIRQRKIQVIHAHQYTPFFYTALARFLHRANAKVVFTEHGRHYPDVVSWKRRWSNRLILRHFAETTTACCDFSTQALRELEGFSRACTVPNGVDLERLPGRDSSVARDVLRKQLGLDAHSRYVVCVARFHPVKDHGTLIRSWATVHRKIPDARLLLVGDGEERQNIADLIDDISRREMALSQLGTTVSFLGVRDDVAQILRACDVFTLTSVSEAASLTLLEAMASECPPVVTDVGGNAEHVRDGQDGFLVPRGDSDSLAKRLVELLSDDHLAMSLGASARRRVAKRFQLTHAIGKYREHYCRLAGEHRATGNSGEASRTRACEQRP